MGRFVDVFLLSILLAEPVAGAQVTASEKALAEDAFERAPRAILRLTPDETLERWRHFGRRMPST